MTELFTTLAATEGHAEAAPAGIQALGLDPLAILAQAVTFLVLFWIVKKFALDKIVTTLEERRKTIDKGVHLGIEMQTERDKLEESVERELQRTRLEADKILAGAHEEAGSIVKSAEDRASAKVETMLTDAHARIEDDVRKAKRELQKEVIGLVADATEKVLGEKIDSSKDEQLIRRALTEVEK